MDDLDGTLATTLAQTLPYTALGRLLKIALPIVKHYHDDVRVHDATTLRNREPNVVHLWMCREMGSHLCRAPDGGSTITQRAAMRDYFVAVQNNHPGAIWYVIIGEEVRQMEYTAALETFFTRSNHYA